MSEFVPAIAESVQPPCESSASAADAVGMGDSVADQPPPFHLDDSPQVEPNAANMTKPLADRVLRYRDLNDGLDLLPPYARSLLKIKIPVIVTLAETKQPIGKILELVPGAIIQFNKSCDEMLTLEAGGQHVALGEAVKVGDKFGLRITSIKMPDERFTSVRSPHANSGC